ncbi:MAG: hypothetical protein HC908_07295 [Calothrix sp. SM1_7_51]|nr:hypothetical protein [Calothrix sp. SM1_7_51]
MTANEGDARSEEQRVSGLNLDATKFPDAATLKLDANLGRLQVSNIDGDIDGDGDYDRLQAYGTRSFSIWDDQGKLVYNSGDQFEQIIARDFANIFNSEGTAADKDTRSDNKGPEPEGVAIGVINNRTYAFIGLERVGGVMVYEVTNPQKPQFVEYVPNQTGDLSPEGVAFIPASESPNGKNLLVVSHEVSNTVAVFEVNPPTRISDIQGAAHRSPLVGQTVQNVRGIITSLVTTGSGRGFYIQDPNPDSNNATSEAVFVFMGSSWTPPTGLAVGTSVQVAGRVDEFRPGNNANNLTITQINGTVTGAAVNQIASLGTITPTVIGTGGRIPPNAVIQNDFTTTAGNVETGGDFDPVTEGIDFYESLEGMFVQINNGVATSPTNSFGETWVLPDNGANATGRTARGGSLISANDYNPERVQIDDDLFSSGTSPKVNVGATFNTITGVVSYNFNNYEVLPTSLAVASPGTLAKETTTLAGDTNNLTIAAFNVEKLRP